MFYKIFTGKYTPFIAVGMMTAPLIKHIGLRDSILIGIGTFILVRGITFKIEKHDAI